MNYISGEKIQYECDIYIGDNEFDKRCWIYNNTLFLNKCLSIRKINYSKLKNVKKIFIYTHVFTINNNKIFEILKHINNNFIIVFHNSDYTIDKSFIKLINDTKCIKIFGQNVIYNSPKIQYLPIGLANSKWKHGNLNLFNKIVNQDIKKVNEIFFNFSIGTNRSKRLQCYNNFKNILKFSRYSNQAIYWKQLKKCKYAISPDGNGPDCHRIWECLYLNVIPICKKSTFTEIISKDFPIYMIDDWSKLKIDNNLYNEYENNIKKLDRNKLQLDFWCDLINNSLQN